MPLALVEQLIKDNRFVREKIIENGWTKKVAPAKIEGLIRSFEEKDLNGDGKPEFIFLGISCGTANCDTWVYKKDNSGYVKILEENSVDVDILKTKTKGYFDLKIVHSGGASGYGERVYKFNGKQYLVRECFEVNNYDSNGNRYKKPKTIKIKCGS